MRPVEPPVEIERRARWVLDTLGARDLGFGDDVPYVEAAWEAVRRGERPAGDELAEAFFHLARLEELGDAPRDRHGRFPAASSCLEPLDPPLERLRRRLGLEPPRWAGARFAVALTHDVDTPWRWTRAGIRGAAARLRDSARAGRAGPALREARALAAVPLHKLRGTDPNWRFERMLRIERARAVSSTFFVMAGHGHPADGAVPAVYERVRAGVEQKLADSGNNIWATADIDEAIRQALQPLHLVARVRLDGHDAGARVHLFQAAADAHQRTARAQPGHEHIDLRQLFQDFEGIGANAANQQLFRGTDKAAASSLGLGGNPFTGGIEIGTVKNNLGPQAAHRRDFAGISAFRHGDGCLEAVNLGCKSDALAVVAS